MWSLCMAYKALTDSHTRPRRQGGNENPRHGNRFAVSTCMATAKEWSCSRCGYSDDHDRPPQHCPSCGTARLYFLALRPVKVPLVTRGPSRWSLLEID